MRAIVYGLVASFFFAFTFILNRSMELGGGSWAWSASLRFFFMLPLLFVVVWRRGGTSASLAHLRRHGVSYALWSTVGFGLFYAPLCFGSVYGEGWLVAGTWQITIIAGPLLAPFLFKPGPGERGLPFYRRIPFGAMRWSLLILAGIGLMQFEHARLISPSRALLCILPILLAAFAYPLGNRKMMEVCKDDVDTFQRVFNMTLASIPFWTALALWGAAAHGLPSSGQVAQSFLVALFSGLIATVLFFAATNIVKEDPARLASVEATQAGEILFALAGELILLSSPLPSALSLAGVCLVIAGMVLHSLRRA